MGCVVTAVVIEGNTATVGHVGDTRALKLRPGSMQQITTDHSPVGRNGQLSYGQHVRNLIGTTGQPQVRPRPAVLLVL